ncbi:MAG: hypothetical protein HYU63_07410 [Armatimonadetes bacterium]|nr:hypothetical protein [Armatimonadota bacterium]
MKINNFNELLKILRCPDCRSLKIQEGFKTFICTDCKRNFEITDNKIIKMRPKNELPYPEIYNNQDYLKWKKVSSEAMLDYFEKGNRLFYIIILIIKT